MKEDADRLGGKRLTSMTRKAIFHKAAYFCPAAHTLSHAKEWRT